MRQLTALAAVILISLSPAAARQPGNTLAGVVTDSATGKPLAGVSVYLNNTSRGTASRADGSFELRDLPPGAYELIFSAIGFRPYVTEINSSRPPPPLHIMLSARAEDLVPVTVAPYDRNGWARYGTFFLNNFIGSTENASSCSLRNREVLRFYFSRRLNRLIVRATAPLIIENDALGYLLTYRLVSFNTDFTAKVVTYVGYPFFQQLVPKRENLRRKWQLRRREAYAGSKLHFMRSLYAGRLAAEGFTVRPDSLMTVSAGGIRELSFDGSLDILYGFDAYGARITDTGDFVSSSIRMETPAAVKIEKNGSYFPPKAFVEGGYWGQYGKICNLLPLDYNP